MFRFKLSVLFVLLSFTTSAQQAAWEWVHPKPSGNAFYTCIAADASTAVLIGTNEEIMRTTDQGLSWTLVHPYNGRRSVFNVASTRTENGSLLSLGIRNTDVSPGPSELRRSVDGGLTWQEITAGFDLLDARDIDAAGGLIAACGATPMLLSNDNGESWRHVVADADENLTNVAVHRNGMLITGGRSGKLWLSADTGQSWSMVTSFPENIIVKLAWYDNTILCWTSNDSLFSVSQSGEILAASRHRAVMSGTWLVREPVIMGYEDFSDGQGPLWSRSTDGGHTWTTVPAKRTVPIPPICALSDSVFIAGSGAPMRSTDAGLTWTGGPEFPDYTFAKITFRDENYGILVTGTGEILLSSDSGYNWVLADSGAYAPNDVFFLDDSAALIATDGGRILLSRDAGKSWTIALEGGLPLHMARLSNTEAIAAEKKFLWRTSDAGATWVKQAIDSSAGSYYIENIAFADSHFGVLFGSRGFYTTTDGGWSWTQAAGKNYPGMYSFASPSPGTIIAVGGLASTGMIYKSSDAGATWSMVYSSGGLFDEDWFSKVRFRDAMHGLCVGIDGVTLWTSDGGDRWFKGSASHTLNVFSECGFAGDSAAFAIGGDVIMRTQLTADPVSVGQVMPAVSSCEIVSCSPLPVRDNAEILVRITAAGHAELLLTDMYGRTVKSIHSAELSAGEHHIPASFGGVAPGAYMLQMLTTQGTHAKPIVILH
ncbi:MAG: hypothetical protein WBQ23_00765 [Bacteroidota bacterium]